MKKEFITLLFKFKNRILKIKNHFDYIVVVNHKIIIIIVIIIVLIYIRNFCRINRIHEIGKNRFLQFE